MKKLITTMFAGALAAAAMAPLAHAQSGYDTGAKKGSGTTTNSGEARPDATSSGTSGAETSAPTRAAPTQGTVDGSGSGMARPDASSANTSGAPDAGSPSRAAPTQNR